MAIEKLATGEQATAADMNAFLEEAIRDYGGLVRHICRNAIRGRPEDVDECVSDVFAALWQKVESGGFEPFKGKLKSYICGIARNKAIDRYRKLAAQPAVLSFEAESADGAGTFAGQDFAAANDSEFAELLAGIADDQMVAEAVDSLPSPDREIFVLRYYYLESVKAIAKRLGLPAKTVENKLHRGKRPLREKLAGTNYFEEKSCGNSEVIIYG